MRANSNAFGARDVDQSNVSVTSVVPSPLSRSSQRHRWPPACRQAISSFSRNSTTVLVMRYESPRRMDIPKVLPRESRSGPPERAESTVPEPSTRACRPGSASRLKIRSGFAEIVLVSEIRCSATGPPLSVWSFAGARRCGPGRPSRAGQAGRSRSTQVSRAVQLRRPASSRTMIS